MIPRILRALDLRSTVRDPGTYVLLLAVLVAVFVTGVHFNG